MSQKKVLVSIVHYVIMIALIVCIRSIPPLEPITVKGMQLLGILV